MEKNIHEIPEIRVFLDSNLNFTVRVFAWGLASDLHICKNLQNISFCLIWPER